MRMLVGHSPVPADSGSSRSVTMACISMAVPRPIPAVTATRSRRRDVIEYQQWDRTVKEQIMADAPAEHPAPQATVADVMQPPVTTVVQNDHVAAAAYLMKRANATALVVTQAQTGQPIGIITEADISHLVADGKSPNDVRIYQLMTTRPIVVNTTTSIRDAAKVMTSRRFRHLPVIGDTGLVGIVDLTDVCRALLEADLSAPPAAVADEPEI
ncbi:MAG: CBS domain-containing protein [Actinobacteria bacterium]|nr:CBS domain-containing protein [Actinomycetota bacterium]